MAPLDTADVMTVLNRESVGEVDLEPFYMPESLLNSSLDKSRSQSRHH